MTMVEEFENFSNQFFDVLGDATPAPETRSLGATAMIAVRQKEPPLSVAELFNETAPLPSQQPELVVRDVDLPVEDTNADIVKRVSLVGSSPQCARRESSREKPVKPPKRPSRCNSRMKNAPVSIRTRPVCLWQEVKGTRAESAVGLRLRLHRFRDRCLRPVHQVH
jgi:hypothetical protein